MKHKYRIWTGIFTAIALFVLVIDSKDALSGAAEGITLCIYSVIPSLFPFFFLCTILNDSIKCRAPFLHRIGRLFGIPSGAESYLILGLLSGYPVSARNINQAYKKGILSLGDARRMLGFCCNAGPSFIFGLLAPMFVSKAAAWALWGIHIAAALIVGYLLPGKQKSECMLSQDNDISVIHALEQSLKSMAMVCGWIILFRVLIKIIHNWVLWSLPNTISTIFCGLLELTNGCLSLNQIPNDGTRFIIASGLLSSGGICVAMQTLSVTKETGPGAYFPGKILQCLISITFACSLQTFIFTPKQQSPHTKSILLVNILTLGLYLLYVKTKKHIAFRKHLWYNVEKHSLR